MVADGLLPDLRPTARPMSPPETIPVAVSSCSAAELDRRLRHRLLAFVRECGAREAHFDFTNEQSRLCGVDGRNNRFSLMIDGEATAWHAALDRLTARNGNENPTAGLMRFLGPPRGVSLQTSLSVVSFGLRLGHSAASSANGTVPTFKRQDESHQTVRRFRHQPNLRAPQFGGRRA
jgi:hypothetical protein